MVSIRKGPMVIIAHGEREVAYSFEELLLFEVGLRVARARFVRVARRASRHPVCGWCWRSAHALGWWDGRSSECGLDVCKALLRSLGVAELTKCALAFVAIGKFA